MYFIIMLLWVILNGKITLEVILVGLVLTAAAGILMRIFYGYTVRRDFLFLKKIPLILVYFGILVAQILKSSLIMLRILLHRTENIDPYLVTFDSGLQTDLGRFLLANSITLTPGTITIQTEGSVFTVHCLERTMLDTDLDGLFIRWIRKIEK